MEDFNLGMQIQGGIEKIGPQGSGVRRYFTSNKKKSPNPKLKHFRVGEVLQGRILSSNGDGSGLVRLPSGDFQCSVHKGLSVGDDLFFKITATDPSLTLRVHAVLTYFKGRKRSKDEIVRILDLPNEELFLAASEIYLTYKNMIYKEDLLDFYRFYSKVPNPDSYQVEALCRTLFWITESGLPFEFDIFESSYKYFSNIHLAENLLNTLFIKIYPKLSESFKNLLLPYRIAYYNLGNSSLSGLAFFSFKNFGNNPSFYELMKRLSVPQLMNLLEGVPKKLVEFIDAMHIWNTICTGSDAAYHWSFPIRILNKSKLITMVIRSQFNLRGILANESPSTIHEIDVGDILNTLFGMNPQFEEALNKIQDIRELPALFSSQLSDKGLSLLAIFYIDGATITLESDTGASVASNRSISFVV